MERLHDKTLSLSNDVLGFAFLHTIFRNGALNLQDAGLDERALQPVLLTYPMIFSTPGKGLPASS
jgi:hypothetical protein